MRTLSAFSEGNKNKVILPKLQILKTGSIRFILSILLIPACLGASAQLMQFQQAKKHFMDGQYHKALEYFNQTISQERSGNTELLTEAYYLRGLTYIRLHGEAFMGDDTGEQKRFEDALLSAYRDFKSSLGYDNGSYWKKIDLEIKNLHHALLQEGLKSLNEYNDLVYNGKPDPSRLKRAEDYLLATHEIRDSYLVNDLLGQVCLDKGMKSEARSYFLKASQLYNEKLPDEPDFLMAYVYYRLAAIDKPDSIRIAMQNVERGIRLVQSEYDRFRFMKDKLSETRVTEMESQYELAMHDLNSIKLDLYLSDQDLYIEALHVFEEQLLADPDNTDLLAGYASLLERSDRAKAIETYEKILSMDPGHPLALFNTGALYYSKGKELFDLAQDEKDSRQFQILADEAIADFEQARPYFEKALEADPESLEAVLALKTIAFILDDKEAYLKYQNLEKTLQ